MCQQLVIRAICAVGVSTAFNVIDHIIRLSFAYGTTGCAFELNKLYKTDIHQHFVIGTSTSNKCHLKFIVSQSSVLGTTM